jgi:hypothetical protein
MIARRIRQWRPMLTFSKRMQSSTLVKELTRTLGDRIEWWTWPPEMMHPSEMSESVAFPTRPSASLAKTNLVGG